jgi:hypothetical protein
LQAARQGPGRPRQMDGCSTTESGLSACYGKAPLRRGFSMGGNGGGCCGAGAAWHWPRSAVVSGLAVARDGPTPPSSQHHATAPTPARRVGDRGGSCSHCEYGVPPVAAARVPYAARWPPARRVGRHEARATHPHRCCSPAARDAARARVPTPPRPIPAPNRQAEPTDARPHLLTPATPAPPAPRRGTRASVRRGRTRRAPACAAPCSRWASRPARAGGARPAGS